MISYANASSQPRPRSPWKVSAYVRGDDLDKVWVTATEGLPALLEALQPHVPPEEGQTDPRGDSAPSPGGMSSFEGLARSFVHSP